MFNAQSSDSYGIGHAIGGVLDLVGNGITGAINKNIAEQNLEHQKDVFEYQKALQQTIFDREDTAFQRASEDLRRAGLNRQLATGASARAGEAINVSAPQNDFRMGSLNLGQIAQAIEKNMQFQEQRRVNDAQIELMQAQAQQAHANADFTSGARTDETLARIPLNNARVDYTNSMTNRNGVLNDLTLAQQREINARIHHLKVSDSKMNREIDYINSQLKIADIKIGGYKLDNFQQMFELAVRGYDFQKYYERDLPTNANYETKTLLQQAARMSERLSKFRGELKNVMSYDDFINQFVANPTNLMNIINLFSEVEK